MAFDLDDDELRETRKMKNLDRELIVGEYVRTKDEKLEYLKVITIIETVNGHAK